MKKTKTDGVRHNVAKFLISHKSVDNIVALPWSRGFVADSHRE